MRARDRTACTSRLWRADGTREARMVPQCRGIFPVRQSIPERCGTLTFLAGHRLHRDFHPVHPPRRFPLGSRGGARVVGGQTRRPDGEAARTGVGEPRRARRPDRHDRVSAAGDDLQPSAHRLGQASASRHSALARQLAPEVHGHRRRRTGQQSADGGWCRCGALDHLRRSAARVRARVRRPDPDGVHSAESPAGRVQHDSCATAGRRKCPGRPGERPDGRRPGSHAAVRHFHSLRVDVPRCVLLSGLSDWRSA